MDSDTVMEDNQNASRINGDSDLIDFPDPVFSGDSTRLIITYTDEANNWMAISPMDSDKDEEATEEEHADEEEEGAEEAGTSSPRSRSSTSTSSDTIPIVEKSSDSPQTLKASQILLFGENKTDIERLTKYLRIFHVQRTKHNAGSPPSLDVYKGEKLKSLWLPRNLKRSGGKTLDAAFDTRVLTRSLRLFPDQSPKIIRYNFRGSDTAVSTFKSKQSRQARNIHGWNELVAETVYNNSLDEGLSSSISPSFRRLAQDFFHGREVLDDEAYEHVEGQALLDCDAFNRETHEMTVIFIPNSPWIKELKQIQYHLLRENHLICLFLTDVALSNHAQTCAISNYGWDELTVTRRKGLASKAERELDKEAELELDKQTRIKDTEPHDQMDISSSASSAVGQLTLGEIDADDGTSQSVNVAKKKQKKKPYGKKRAKINVKNDTRCDSPAQLEEPLESEPEGSSRQQSKTNPSNRHTSKMTPLMQHATSNDNPWSVVSNQQKRARKSHVSSSAVNSDRSTSRAPLQHSALSSTQEYVVVSKQSHRQPLIKATVATKSLRSQKLALPPPIPQIIWNQAQSQKNSPKRSEPPALEAEHFPVLPPSSKLVSKAIERASTENSANALGPVTYSDTPAHLKSTTDPFSGQSSRRSSHSNSTPSTPATPSNENLTQTEHDSVSQSSVKSPKNQSYESNHEVPKTATNNAQVLDLSPPGISSSTDLPCSSMPRSSPRTAAPDCQQYVTPVKEPLMSPTPKSTPATAPTTVVKPRKMPEMLPREPAIVALGPELNLDHTSLIQTYNNSSDHMSKTKPQPAAPIAAPFDSPCTYVWQFRCTYCRASHNGTEERPVHLCAGCGCDCNIRYCSRTCLLADAYDHSLQCMQYWNMPNVLVSKTIPSEVYVLELSRIPRWPSQRESQALFRQKCFSMLCHDPNQRFPLLKQAWARRNSVTGTAIPRHSSIPGDYFIFSSAVRSGDRTKDFAQDTCNVIFTIYFPVNVHPDDFTKNSEFNRALTAAFLTFDVPILNFLYKVILGDIIGSHRQDVEVIALAFDKQFEEEFGFTQDLQHQADESANCSFNWSTEWAAIEHRVRELESQHPALYRWSSRGYAPDALASWQ